LSRGFVGTDLRNVDSAFLRLSTQGSGVYSTDY
jgi:hypothetical protein